MYPSKSLFPFHLSKNIHFFYTKYYLPEDITPQMYGRKIRIVGGPLDGYEGNLITTRGSKVKRLMIKLQDFFAAGVEVNPEYIQFI